MVFTQITSDYQNDHFSPKFTKIEIEHGDHGEYQRDFFVVFLAKNPFFS